VRRRPPVRQAIRLLLEQRVQRIERVRLPGRAVELGEDPIALIDRFGREVREHGHVARVDRQSRVEVGEDQFRRPGFCEQVERALDRSGISPKRLEIEITEGVLLHETEETLATLRRLRALGVSIAMDDFGTGYSSLGYLQKFHFDKLKIDRSFVSALQTDTQAAAIVRAVVRMSHAMGIRVLAEGVEHAEQASALHDEGCEEAQGFLFGRALPATQFRDLLAQSTLRLPQHEPAPA